MATIRSIAAAHGIEPYALKALADMNTIPETLPLVREQEALLIELLAAGDDD